MVNAIKLSKNEANEIIAKYLRTISNIVDAKLNSNMYGYTITDTLDCHGKSFKRLREIKNDLISRNADENDERAVFLENKKNDYIALRNRLRNMKAPGFEDLEAKVKQGRELTDYEKKVFEARKLMNVLYDSVNEEKPFGAEYEEAERLIDKLEDDLNNQ